MYILSVLPHEQGSRLIKVHTDRTSILSSKSRTHIFGPIFIKILTILTLFYMKRVFKKSWSALVVAVLLGPKSTSMTFVRIYPKKKDFWKGPSSSALRLWFSEQSVEDLYHKHFSHYIKVNQRSTTQVRFSWKRDIDERKR